MSALLTHKGAAFDRLRSARIEITGLPVTVPEDYLGMHFHRWPNGSPLSPAPTGLGYKSYRTHDGSVGGWSGINTADGVYNWAELDAVIAAHEATGASIMFTVYSTPTWAATAAGQTHNDLYDKAGGADKPADLTKLSAFITALVSRYNGTTRRIKYLECWNEPNFLQNWTGFFWGTAVDMVAMCNAIYTAAKAADPGIIVLSPGFTHYWNCTAEWLNAYDPVSAKYGKNVCDGIALHPYGAHYLYNNGDTIGTNPVGIDTVKGLLTAASVPNLPIYITEYGIDGASSPVVTAFLNSSNFLRNKQIARLLIMAALKGAKTFYLYSYDGASKLSGDYINDAEGVRAAVNEVGPLICGKTITSAAYYTDGTVEFVIGGAVYTV